MKRNRKIMISAFDKSTIMAQPWAAAGFECYCIDIQHPRGETRDGNIIRVGADVRDWLPPTAGEIAFAAFFPPCTDTAVSGAQWFQGKGLGALARAIENFKRAVDMATMMRCRFLIENPVSTISSYWRKPDFIFHPNHYGDPYLKTTCLWVGGGFQMPERTPVEPVEGQKLWRLPPTEDRADKRSVTPKGFAEAVFRKNAGRRHR